MSDYDYERYANAERFFGYLRSRLAGLETMRLELEESEGYLKGVRYDGASGKGGASDTVSAAALAHGAQVEALTSAVASVDTLLAAAESAIDGMERSGLGSDDDAALLRMYYILRWPNGRIAQRLRYASAKYVSDRRAVALMHVALFVPSRW